MAVDADQADDILRAVRDSEAAFVIQGTNSKKLMAPALPEPAQVIELAGHAGILDYVPSELMMRVRSGTLLTDLMEQLATHGQMLPFEAPLSADGLGTIGGAVSSALEGPARPWRGAVRDAVLGVRMISGQGQLLSFGGQVMKNVAGYDISRLTVGAWGTLGPLLDVCLKLLPCPEYTETRCFELDQKKALTWLIQEQRRPWPLTGAAWEAGCLRVRLAGNESDVRAASVQLGGTHGDNVYWSRLRDGILPVQQEASYYLADVPPATEAHADTLLLDWGGARRWFPADISAETRQWITHQGGNCRQWPGVGLALGGTLGELQMRLKAVLDPAGRCNPHLVVADATG